MSKPVSSDRIEPEPAPASAAKSSRRCRRASGDLERTKAATRAALLKAAGELFSEQGIDVPSLDAICDRAGFTRGAFYVHFTDRDELVRAVCAEYQSNLLQQISVYDDSPEALPNLLRRLLGAETNVPLHQFLHAVERCPELATSFRETLQEAVDITRDATRFSQAFSTVRGDVDPEALSQVLVALSMGMQAMREAGAPVDSERAARLFNGLWRR
ncbi:MAG: TetR/AcrR family transcriptional regulator [Polyangiaceae bacterium]